MKKKIFTLLAMVMVAMTASAKIGYALTKGANAHGTTTIKVDDAEADLAVEGTEVTVVVTPAKDYYVATVVARLYTTWGGAKTRGTSMQIDSKLLASKVKDKDNTYTFKMPAANVEVSVSYIESMEVETKKADNEDKAVDNVQVGIVPSNDADPYIDTETGEAVVPVEANSIKVPDQAEKTDVTVVIKPRTKSADGSVTYEIGKIVKNSFVTGSNSNAQVVGVFFEKSKNAIVIEDGAMTVDGRVLKVQTDISMLDDYANMTSLEDNVKQGVVSATAKPKNMYWTFSSGIDVLLPKGVKAYKVLWNNNAAEIVELTEEELKLKDELRGIKANNGVLLSCDSGEGGAEYVVVASPAAKITGAKPATSDAKSYTGNCLVPTIEDYNYSPASSYRMMHGNKFHTMSANGKVPACRAVLKVK